LREINHCSQDLQIKKDFPPLLKADQPTINMTSDISHTAILLIDPLNDMLHKDGKLYPLLEESIKHTDPVSHIFDLIKAARAKKIPIFYGLHQTMKEGTFAGWKHMMAIHNTQKDGSVFEEGKFGSQIIKGMEPDLENGDVVVGKHWTSR
jgi:nicotinamidase-related amidase